ncbi:serine/threonine-protein kinase [Streptomyces sp. NPDC007346]|uniref:serine/threonine-protein kinase n=1 Tax=Streptomyces sp. NPDC007346 TaxID=3154682 RepID=UPI0034540939
MTSQQQGNDGVFQPLEESDPRTVAGYRLTAKLGSGGMGKVYLSYTPGGRPVAIKVIRPDFSEDAEFRRRFQQEVQAAQRVQGLYTAPVIDSDTESAQQWLATAYVPGPSLATAVGEHGPLPVPAILLLIAGMAEALHVIHGAGIVHRDLKPSNVLLAADGPRVIDFGIARAADATSLTGSGVTVGTPAFMAPEQAAGRSVTAATDIFALGQVAAFAATGAPAFGEGTSHGVLYRVVHEEPDLTGVPEELRELVTRCLAKSPEDRPSVAEVIDLCRNANSETQLRRPEDWLPGAVAADITVRVAAPAPDRTPPPPSTPPTPPTAPLTVPATPPPTAPVTAPVTVAQQPPTVPAPTAPAPSTPAAPPGAHQQPGVTANPAPGAYGYPTQPQGAYGYPSHAGPAQQPGPYGYPQTGSPSGGYAGGYPPAYPSAGQQPQQPQAPQPPAPEKPKKKRTGLFVTIAVVAALAAGAGGGYAVYGPKGDTDGGKDQKQEQNQAGGDTAKPQQKEPAASTPSAGTDVTDDDDDTGDDEGSGAAPLPDPEPVAYKSIDLTAGYHLSLADSTDSPRNGSSGDFAYSSISSVVRTNGSMVLLNPGQQGDLQTCRSETRFSTKLALDRLVRGTQICVRTDNGHLGLVVVRALPAANAAANYMTLDVTVWRNAIAVDES